MTVSALNVSSGPYTANGSTTVFPFTFSAGSTSEVQVLVNGVAIAFGFTIVLNANQSTTPGGSVTFTSAPANGAVILVTSNPNFQQLISFRDSGPFLQSTLDTALDRAARLLLYLRDKLSRTVVFPVGETASALPSQSSRAGKFLGFDGSGNFVALPGTSGDPGLRSDLAASTGYTLVGGIPHVVTPQQFAASVGLGTLGLGSQDDSPAFAAAIAYLKAFALNSGGGAYKGSPKLFIPAGHYYLGTTTLDINHTLIIEGEGSGRAPAPGYGCTHLRWADGVCGIRIQCFNTSGTSTVDVVQHDAAGSAYLKDFSMEGGHTSTDSASHAIVVRSITYLDDILIRNWSGTGVLSWTGNVNGSAYGGNTSVSRYTGVKVEGCKVGFDTRGTDSNVITFTNCEGYQCRQAGFIDDNGAGSNTYFGTHATANGVIGGSGNITQVSYSGKYYAVRWGQEGGAATNAPSGTTDDNTWWAYAGTGPTDTAHPAWASGMSNLISGGDYVMLSNYPTILINCYSEGGGFSQLAVGTLAIGGTNLGLTSVGGSCLVPEYNGLALKRTHGAALLHLDGASNGAENGFTSRDAAGNTNGSIVLGPQGATLQAGVGNGYRFNTLTGGVATLRCQIMYYGIDLPTGEAYYINSTQVVGARQTGWTAGTGTANKGAFATYAGHTASASYVQAEAQSTDDATKANSQRIKAIEDALRTHGLIN
jgi:hypothetical protein